MIEYDDNEELEEMEESDQDTAGYLCDLCDFLADPETVSFHKREIISELEILEEDLNYLEVYYRKPAPKGGEAATEVMLDAILQFKQSIEEIYLYFEDGDKDRLKKSKEMALNAFELINFLKTSIARKRLELAEILSKLESGELNEGEPIPQDEESSFTLTDQEEALEKLRTLPKARDTSFLEDYGIS
jgi:hypothetical protein